jgi:hypothetical protein
MVASQRPIRPLRPKATSSDAGHGRGQHDGQIDQRVDQARTWERATCQKEGKRDAGCQHDGHCACGGQQTQRHRVSQNPEGFGGDAITVTQQTPEHGDERDAEEEHQRGGGADCDPTQRPLSQGQSTAARAFVSLSARNLASSG